MDLVISDQALLQLETVKANPPHAVLLSGSEGIGKSLIARQIALELLDATTSIENNPYLHIIEPAKGTIPIATVRNLQKFFRLQVPGSSKVKRVAIIIDADTMGTEAQNALLKLVEEPPEGSVLLLTSSHPLGLLPTIQSRIQTVHVQDPSKAQLSAHFQAAGYESSVVQRALTRYGGNIAAIVRELEGVHSDESASSLEMAKKIISSSRYERLLLVDKLSKEKSQTEHVLTALQAIADSGLQAAVQKDTAAITRWYQVLRAIATAQDSIAKNGNTKLLLTELMLEL